MTMRMAPCMMVGLFIALIACLTTTTYAATSTTTKMMTTSKGMPASTSGAYEGAAPMVLIIAIQMLCGTM